MSDDPVRIEDTQLWLTKAQRDLASAIILANAIPPLYDAAVYHCQQAGEKAIKGFLYWHDSAFTKTHDLEKLIQQASKIEPVLSQFLADARMLTPFATQYRYPTEDDELEPSQEVAQAAIESAEEIISTILELLPQISRYPH